ncbi:transposase DNA-binding-containing protein [Bradyrhizobium sp. CCBAU 11361]|uniref:transposase DNA-binding-containing protein n=1 Tax=Bradyrhizobium sp. CCBAU 11361 TaxID=1630812 RepID=UPI003FA469E0
MSGDTGAGAAGWDDDEVVSAGLPDKRLARRFGRLLDQMSAAPGQPARPRAATKAAYSFFDNPRVTERDAGRPFSRDCHALRGERRCAGDSPHLNRNRDAKCHRRGAVQAAHLAQDPRHLLAPDCNAGRLPRAQPRSAARKHRGVARANTS